MDGGWGGRVENGLMHYLLFNDDEEHRAHFGSGGPSAAAGSGLPFLLQLGAPGPPQAHHHEPQPPQHLPRSLRLRTLPRLVPRLQHCPQDLPATGGRTPRLRPQRPLRKPPPTQGTNIDAEFLLSKRFREWNRFLAKDLKVGEKFH